MLVAANAGHCTLPGTDHGCKGLQVEESFLAKEYTLLVNKYLNAAGVNTVFIQEDSLSAICAIPIIPFFKGWISTYFSLDVVTSSFITYYLSIKILLIASNFSLETPMTLFK